MLAPIDAVATVQAGDDKIVLRLNMRTLALAREGGVNLLKVGSLAELDPLEFAVLTHAFAVPEQPDFDPEQAFALLVRYTDETKAALVSLTAQFASASQAGAREAARPTKGQKPPTS